MEFRIRVNRQMQNEHLCQILKWNLQLCVIARENLQICMILRYYQRNSCI